MDTQVVLEKILHLSSRMAETRDLQPLLVYAVDVALDLFNAEHGYLVLKAPDDRLDFRVKRKRSGSDIAEPEISYQVLGRALTDGKAVVAADALQEFDTSPSVHVLNLRSVMCVPLITQNHVIGALYLDHRIEQNVFTETDLKFLQLFANQAAVSIENAISNGDLELRIQMRTTELRQINARLHDEIDEHQETQRQLVEMLLHQERIKLLAAFIQDASHQFFTPLSIINTSTYLMRRKSALESKHLTNIETAAKTITALVKSLVVMANLDSGIHNAAEQIDLGDLAGRILVKLSSQITEKRLQLAVDCPINRILLIGNLEQLEEAVWQLLQNAIQYTPSGGQIEIRVYARNDTSIVEVRDTGIGIEAEELPFIFRRFYRCDKVGSTQGLGLGLSIAEKVAENHGGYVEVHSKPDTCSTFRLVLMSQAVPQFLPQATL